MARKANWCERYLGSDHHTDRFVGSIVKYENKSGIDFHHLPKDYYTAHCPRNVKQLVVEAEEDGPRRHLLSQVRAFKAGYSEAPSRSSSPRPARRFSVDYGVLARRPRSRAVSPAPLGRDYRSVTPSCSRPDSLPPASRVNSARSSVARDSGPQDFESTPYKPVLEERPRASVPRAPSLQRSIQKMGRYRSASFSAGSGYSPEYSVVRTGMTKGYDDMPSPAYAIHRAAAISRYTQDDAADLASRSRRADREFLDAVTRRIESTIIQGSSRNYRSRSAQVSRAATPVRSRSATPYRFSASYTASRSSTPARAASPAPQGVYGPTWSASDDSEILEYLNKGSAEPEIKTESTAGYDLYRSRSAHVSRAATPVRSRATTPYRYSASYTVSRAASPVRGASPGRTSYRGFYGSSWSPSDDAEVLDYLYKGTYEPSYESYRPRYSYSARVSRASSPVRTTYVPYTPVSSYVSSYVSTPYTYSTYRPYTYVSEPYTYYSPYSYRYTPTWTRSDSADVDTYLSGSTYTPRYYYSAYWSPYSTSHKTDPKTEEPMTVRHKSPMSPLLKKDKDPHKIPPAHVKKRTLQLEGPNVKTDNWLDKEGVLDYLYDIKSVHGPSDDVTSDDRETSPVEAPVVLAPVTHAPVTHAPVTRAAVTRAPAIQPSAGHCRWVKRWQEEEEFRDYLYASKGDPFEGTPTVQDQGEGASGDEKEIDLTEDEPSYSYRSQASQLRSSLNLYPEPKERNTADMSWYYETPLNYIPSLYGQLPPPIYTSPAFMMGYHSAAQAAGTMSRRQRKRATSVGPTSSAADLYSSYTRYPSGRLRTAAIEDYPSSSYYSIRSITKRIESQEEESELPPPMSLHSIRNRLLSCADLNDSAKRLYDRYIPVGVEGLEFGSKYNPLSYNYRRY